MVLFHLTDEGLQRSGTEMSQIPTYVTNVPNGTEKVRYLDFVAIDFADYFEGSLSSRGSWWNQFPRLLHSATR